jgi:hypothetical protein
VSRPGPHVAYFNDVLGADYCTGCGDEWPCLPYRQAHPRCLCSHASTTHQNGTGECWTPACGCSYLRLPETRTA